MQELYAFKNVRFYWATLYICMYNRLLAKTTCRVILLLFNTARDKINSIKKLLMCTFMYDFATGLNVFRKAINNNTHWVTTNLSILSVCAAQNQIQLQPLKHLTQFRLLWKTNIYPNY